MESILNTLGTIIEALDTLPSTYCQQKLLMVTLVDTSNSAGNVHNSIENVPVSAENVPVSAENESVSAENELICAIKTRFPDKFRVFREDKYVNGSGYIIKIIYTPPYIDMNFFISSSPSEKSPLKESGLSKKKNQESIKENEGVLIGKNQENIPPQPSANTNDTTLLRRRRRKGVPPDVMKIGGTGKSTNLDEKSAGGPLPAIKSPLKNLIPEDSLPFLLAEGLYELIKKRKIDFKKPNLQEWSRHLDLMIRKDNRDPESIAEVIEWCQQDDFWQNNVLSSKKLRIQFDQLQLKMNAEKTRAIVRASPEVWKVAYLVYDKFRKEIPSEFPESIKSIPITEQLKFISCAERIIHFVKEKSLTIENAIMILFDCLKWSSQNLNKPVYPTHLCSNNTWKIVLPQFIKERYNL
jgi:hypothetical protein